MDCRAREKAALQTAAFINGQRGSWLPFPYDDDACLAMTERNLSWKQSETGKEMDDDRSGKELEKQWQREDVLLDHERVSLVGLCRFFQAYSQGHTYPLLLVDRHFQLERARVCFEEA